MIRLFLAALCAVCFAMPADARPRAKAPPACVETGSVMAPVCMGQRGFLEGVRSIRVQMKRDRIADVSSTAAARVVGGRPAGCPNRFCGCGASLHLFGRIIPSLNLAANWLRFPRAVPAPKMVAARRGHVFVLEQHIAGNTWLVHDSNSGGHRTRLHARSIAGYAIVNPSGAG